MNTKVDALIRMSLANVSESAQRLEDCFQTILTLDRVDVLPVESKANLYQRVCMINQTDELLSFNRQQLKKTKLIIEVQINKHRRDVIYEVDD